MAMHKGTYPERVAAAKEAIQRQIEKDRGTQVDGDPYHWKLTVLPRLYSRYGRRAVEQARQENS